MLLLRNEVVLFVCLFSSVLDLRIASALLWARFSTRYLNTTQWLGAFSDIPEQLPCLLTLIGFSGGMIEISK